MKKALITHQIGENWELLLRQADQDNGKNKGKYISLCQKLCHLFKNRLNNFVETPFKYRWRGTERWNLNLEFELVLLYLQRAYMIIILRC